MANGQQVDKRLENVQSLLLPLENIHWEGGGEA